MGLLEWIGLALAALVVAWTAGRRQGGSKERERAHKRDTRGAKQVRRRAEVAREAHESDIDGLSDDDLDQRLRAARGEPNGG